MRFPATFANSNVIDNRKAQVRFSTTMWIALVGAAVSVAGGLGSCSSDSSPVAPTGAVVSGPSPTVSMLSVNRGSTRGGTMVEIKGTELQERTTVTFGTATVTSESLDPRDVSGTSLRVDSPASAAGLADVIVTNPDRRLFRLSQAYEYVPQESFDFNGDWDGVTTDDSDTLVQFTIRNNMLVSASCRSDLHNKVVVLSTAVMNGEFSANTHDGLRLSGRIVSASQAIGQITAPQCLSDSHPWRASKLGSLLKTAFLNNAG